jgi:gluconate 2-dehydrogenase gamma chain
VFFQRLVTLTLEGYLSDPKYGGNRDWIGWQFIGRTPCWWAPKRLP